MDQMVGSLADQSDQSVSAAYQFLQAIAPRDELEGALAVQMFSSHNAAMDCMRRANLEFQTAAGREQNLRHAAKFMSLYERQLAALDKHRGKGQSITVKHVTVEAGSHAVVLEVDAGTLLQH
jgi:hypothetical protein